ncbi:MAG TPA: sigma-54 dependent transcriptional regulator [candidate division Zixibacteria bacterium]|nr:sigma-54-dependent Fis family transcriptional regulator [candidate division Zixibacteria bacterium]MDD4917046.1 sigma-54 dependent transcriptional regulator [candidate division Zixibacteria bacterium]MDM7972857.1 sigma-54 dependent transcriptional regulator [candidate division Zixibacteria bacterium]HOD65272.1 sigma-54 dependent transcriptional regulator [candidate division Zixibacteria bacterium]HOZ08648.1 sigma-54 dependent transcriptional regulator [candidate division Zixibacteria bacteri
MRERILVVDDEPHITAAFASLLQGEGYRADTASSAEEAQRRVDSARYDLVLLDLNLPGRSGVEWLADLNRLGRRLPALVISGQSDIATALEAVRLGALDYLEKPVAPEKLLTAVRAALLLSAADRQRALMIDELDRQSPIIGESAAIRKVLRTIDQAAATDVTVLFTGENGTGKELAATRLYLASPRRDKPFIKVNCPGIPPTLFESELFGHARGAFTGAVRDFPGKFALADGGTIFLDEIGDLPLECQAKLLRVLESGEVERLGAEERRTVDVRVAGATNRDLPALVADGKFRADLYYRVSVFVIPLPPLRERREDIPLLAGEFLRTLDPSGQTRLSPESAALLATLDYPGNVRQLRNLIERLTIVCAGRRVEPADIAELSPLTGLPGSASVSLAERVAAYERELIRQALREAGGNIAAAARELKVDRANLSRRIKDLGLK